MQTHLLNKRKLAALLLVIASLFISGLYHGEALAASTANVHDPPPGSRFACLYGLHFAVDGCERVQPVGRHRNDRVAGRDSSRSGATQTARPDQPACPARS